MGRAAHDAENENFDQITDYELEFNDFLLSLGSNVTSPNGEVGVATSGEKWSLE